MKKFLAFLLAAMMLLSLTSCNLTDLLTEPAEMEDDEYEDEYGEDTDDYVPENTGPKIEESKTYTIYKEIWSGPYTMKYEIYNKDFQNPDNQTVGSSKLIVVDGENQYTETISYVGEASSTDKTIVMDGYKYAFFDEYKLIMREKAKKSSGGITVVTEEEAFYQDVNGDPETVTVFGKEYYGEHFAGYGESITYCYDGDTLKYILSKSGGITYTVGVISLEKGADASYFELPDDYEKSWE